MFPKRLWTCILLLLGCSEEVVRSASADPVSELPLGGDEGNEQPSLLLRCEEGRVRAYLVIGSPTVADTGGIDGTAVPVDLDSTYAC